MTQFSDADREFACELLAAWDGSSANRKAIQMAVHSMQEDAEALVATARALRDAEREPEIAALRAENARLRRFAKDTACQKKTTELETEYDVECADFEGAYDFIIDKARAALGDDNES